MLLRKKETNFKKRRQKKTKRQKIKEKSKPLTMSPFCPKNNDESSFYSNKWIKMRQYEIVKDQCIVNMVEALISGNWGSWVWLLSTMPPHVTNARVLTTKRLVTTWWFPQPLAHLPHCPLPTKWRQQIY